MADVENPPVLAATPDPDDSSGLRIVCTGACSACTILAVSGVLVYLFCRSAQASTALRVLAIAGLVVGIVGIAFGASTYVSMDISSGNAKMMFYK
jgi:hypothetical protein